MVVHGRGSTPLRFLPIALWLTLALGAEDPTRPGSGSSTGSLEGTVTVGRELVARRVKFNLYPDPTLKPARLKPLSTPTDELANVVVYFESAPSGAIPTGRVATLPLMEQQELAFAPHVLAVAKGTTVEFPNQDPVYHNVFSLSEAASFDLGRFPSGSSKSIRFDKPGLVKVFCHIHSDMTGVVLVLDNPFFTSPGRDGRYRIDGIPPGDYTIMAWHERAKLSKKKIRIEAGKASVLDFNVPLGEAPRGG